MSRIYHALKQSEKPESSFITTAIDANQAAFPESGLSSSAAVMEPPVISRPEVVEPPAAAPTEGSDYRTVRLRIPAGIPIFPFDGTDARAAEQYRLLRTSLQLHPLRPKLVAVTSPTPGDGKTITSINLAASLALKSDSRVLIVDADLRRASVGTALGVESEVGLAEVLRGQCTLEDAILQVEQIPKLYVLPAGRVFLNPAELLDSDLCRSVFVELRKRFSYIIADSTPMSSVADFRLLYQVCDGALVIVRPDHTNRSAFLNAIDLEPKQKMLGVVINAYRDWFLWKTNDYYAYYNDQKS
jgi:capsular exopolysaccharide synthesis family protein